MKNYTIFIFLIFHVFFVNAQTDNIIVINNISIFNGFDEDLIRANILIEGNIIKGISSAEFKEEESSATVLIDGTDKYLIPGLIDAHTHVTFEDIEVPLSKLTDQVDWATINLIAAKAAQRQLLRGFTTIRNMGGNAIPLAKVIDKGILPGPRIYPSGAFISQSGGHGDLGSVVDVPRTSDNLSYGERIGFTAIADGPSEVLKRAREQLRQGATQLKLMAGGGVSSEFDPLDVTQFTVEEMKAAVQAAENWGTYVAVHAYTPKAIQNAIEAGVKVIEHAQLTDEETMKLMAEKGIWWSSQAFLSSNYQRKEPIDTTKMSPEQKRSYFTLENRNKGTIKAYEWAKKYKVKTAWGTDLFGSPRLADQEGQRLTSLKQFYSPYEILRIATSTNAELLQLTGPRNPYKDGKLGEISRGAYADLIILDENPLENIDLIADPEKNFLVIIKDGVIYKNKL